MTFEWLQVRPAMIRDNKDHDSVTQILSILFIHVPSF